MPSTTVAVTYVGPHDAVEVEVAPQLWRTVAHGETADLPAKVAEALLEQTDTWQTAKPTRSKPPASQED